MGTRGFYCICYRGIYYVFYNHWDSYFSNLGVNLINEIKHILNNNLLVEFLKNVDCLKVYRFNMNTLSDSEKLRLYEYKNTEENNKFDNEIKEYTYKKAGSYIKTLDAGYINFSYIYDTEVTFENATHWDLEYIYILDCDKSEFIIKSNYHINIRYTFDKLKVKTIDEIKSEVENYKI